MTINTKLIDSIGELLRDANVAAELKDKASQASNQNTRFYNFWRFMGSSIFEDIPALIKNVVVFSTSIGDLLIEDGDEEIKKLEKYVATLGKLKVDSNSIYVITKSKNPAIRITTEQDGWIDDELKRLKPAADKTLDSIKARALRLRLRNVDPSANQAYSGLGATEKKATDGAIANLAKAPSGVTETVKQKFIREQTHAALVHYQKNSKTDIAITAEEDGWIESELTTLSAKTTALDKIKVRALRFYLRNVEFNYTDQYAKLTASDKAAVEQTIETIKTGPSDESKQAKFVREQTRKALIYYQEASKNSLLEAQKYLLKEIQTTTENLIKIGNSPDHKKNLENARKVADIIVMGASSVHQLVKPIVDYTQARNEMLIKMMEDQAPDPTSTEKYDLIKTMLEGGLSQIDAPSWTAILEAATKNVNSEVLKYRTEYYEQIKDNIFKDGRPAPIAKNAKNNIFSTYLQCHRDSLSVISLNHMLLVLVAAEGADTDSLIIAPSDRSHLPHINHLFSYFLNPSTLSASDRRGLSNATITKLHTIIDKLELDGNDKIKNIVAFSNKTKVEAKNLIKNT